MTDETSAGSSSAVGAEASQGVPVALPQYPGPAPGHSPESTAQYKMELIDVTGYIVVTLSRRRVVTGRLDELSAAYAETERHNARAKWLGGRGASFRVKKASSANARAWQDVCDTASSDRFLTGGGS
jgi:hypothetical protein